MLILMNPHHFFTTYIWDALNVNVNQLSSRVWTFVLLEKLRKEQSGDANEVEKMP